MAQCPDKTCDAKFKHYHGKSKPVGAQAELCICSQLVWSKRGAKSRKQVDKILDDHLYGTDIVTPCYDPREE